MPEPAKNLSLRAISKKRKGHKVCGVQGFKNRRQVLKMLAVMEPQETSLESVNQHSAEFLSTGRTGRRNAMPDILGEHAVVSSGDLPTRLQGLSTNDGAGTSGTSSTTGTSSSPEPGTSKQTSDAS